MQGFPGAASGNDPFDKKCEHILVECRVSAQLLGCVRVFQMASGSALTDCYSQQFYELERLTAFPNPILELGRFCVAPGPHSADVIRLIWAMVTRMVTRQHTKLLIGCSSVQGTDPADHRAAFDLLSQCHLGPQKWQPGVKSERVVAMDGRAAPTRQGLKQLPPLLRSYLAMGGWVSDHAVIDDDLSTIHVFTGLEVDKIPAQRAARLRRLAA